MLIEAQRLTAGADHAVELSERKLLIGDRAEHECDNSGIERSRSARQTVSAAVLDGDRRRCACRRELCALAQVGLGLHGEDPADRSRIVLEVRSAAGANLYNPAVQSREQLAAMNGASATFAQVGNPCVDAGKIGGGKFARPTLVTSMRE